MAQNQYDLIIAGAGPAGCTLALNLSGRGLRIAVIEKDVFPRHKICGDALSGKVLNVLKRMPGGVYADFLRDAGKVASWGIRFTAPNGHGLDVPFVQERAPGTPPPGYVCRREDFDNFLFQRLKLCSDIDIFEGEKVTGLAFTPDAALVETGIRALTGKIVAGADGVHSVIRKMTIGDPPDKRHFCVGIRAYYKNVTGLHPDNFIELIFLKELLPGYFWIFPSTGGLVNAGFGMMHEQVVKLGENLNQVLNRLVSSHPLIAPRFRNAEISGRAEAHSLPLASFHPKRSGDRFLLLGDAAFMVDPFSGEGIGNAMGTGEIAASVLENCFRINDFSAGELLKFEAGIGRRFSQEFRTTSVMQRLAGSPFLFNLVVDKARKNKNLRDLLTSMFTNEDMKEKLTRPGFYAGLLFK